jgi:hypothetical protein
MREHILGPEGVASLDIDERYNQITLGIEDLDRQQEFREKF